MRRKLVKIFKNTMLIIILIVILALVFPTWTPEIKGQNSISTLGQIEINGEGHEVMMRGTNRKNPILIFVHGGLVVLRSLTLGSINRSLSNILL